MLARLALGGTTAAAGLMLAGCADASGGGATASPADDSPTPSPSNPQSRRPSGSTLVVFFSRAGENYFNGGRRNLQTGNTKVLAQMIVEQLSCDVFEIRASDRYSDDYDDTVARNVREQDSNARPEIEGALPPLERYDTILLGSPIWSVRPPMIMTTFIESVDWTGKTLYPFVTYAVSGLGDTESVYQQAASGAQMGEGLAVRGEEVGDASQRAASWLSACGLL